MDIAMHISIIMLALSFFMLLSPFLLSVLVIAG